MDQVDRNYTSILSREKWITSRPRQIPQLEITSLVINYLILPQLQSSFSEANQENSKNIGNIWRSLVISDRIMVNITIFP